jgi:hypothetical protein
VKTTETRLLDFLKKSPEFVILGESSVTEWHSKNARASELLDFARLRRKEQSNVQERIL